MVYHRRRSQAHETTQECHDETHHRRNVCSVHAGTNPDARYHLVPFRTLHQTEREITTGYAGIDLRTGTDACFGYRAGTVPLFALDNLCFGLLQTLSLAFTMSIDVPCHALNTSVVYVQCK